MNLNSNKLPKGLVTLERMFNSDDEAKNGWLFQTRSQGFRGGNGPFVANKAKNDFTGTRIDDALYEQGRAFVQQENNAGAIERYTVLLRRFPEATQIS